MNCSITSPNLCPFFFFNDTATTEIYTLSLHDALPISARWALRCHVSRQILAELRPHNSRRILVTRRSTLARLHRALLSRLEIYPRHPRNSRVHLWRHGLRPRGMG